MLNNATAAIVTVGLLSTETLTTDQNILNNQATGVKIDHTLEFMNHTLKD